MKNKYISVRSASLLSYFQEKDQDRFEYQEAFAALPDSKKGAVKELLSDMTRRGLLLRLRKGTYQIIPFEHDAATYLPDWHLAAAGVVKGSDYYIGYYSALQLHQLITQPSLKEQIVVSKQLRPSTLTLQNVSFQFIYHNSTHFFGAQKTWIDNFHQVPCSDLEKTFVDCLFKPNYAGGIVEVAKALYTAKQQLQFDKLLTYVQRFRSKAVSKRLGFLLEMLDIDTSIIDYLQKTKTASYVTLDTELPKSGPLISRWSIQQNLDTATIKSAIYT
ncbi:MAG: type IV toxin-antitoxin system AbiEi family antitoxin [Bacteroidota bacterium]